MTLALAILASAAATAATPAPPPPDFEWSPRILVAPPPIFPGSMQPPPPIVISPDNVELVGAGELALKADLAKARPLLDGGRRWRLLRLWFDRSGALLSCERGYSQYGAPRDEMCEAIDPASRFSFAPGFGQPLARGYVNVWADFQLRLTPRLPIRFRPKDKGTLVRMVIDTEGRCRVDSALVTPANTDLLCRTVAASKAAQKAKAGADNNWGSGFNLRLWIDSVPLPPEEQVAVKFEPSTDRVGKNLMYPPRSQSETPMPASHGTFALDLTQADRPEQTRRWSVSAPTSVLVGIGSDGTVQSCRPVMSSGGSWLDNHACVLAATKGRFTPAPGVTANETRYLTWKVDWNALPAAPAPAPAPAPAR